VHDHVAAFLRQGQRGLALEVEMLLPADLDPALDDMGRARASAASTSPLA
jgi:hypothetical protein